MRPNHTSSNSPGTRGAEPKTRCTIEYPQTVWRTLRFAHVIVTTESIRIVAALLVLLDLLSADRVILFQGAKTMPMWNSVT